MHTPGLGTVFGTLYMHNQDDKPGWTHVPLGRDEWAIGVARARTHIPQAKKNTLDRSWLSVEPASKTVGQHEPTVGEHLVFVGQFLQCLASFSKGRVAGGLGFAWGSGPTTSGRRDCSLDSLQCTKYRCSLYFLNMTGHGVKTRQTPVKMKWNEWGFRSSLCTYRLNWARITS